MTTSATDASKLNTIRRERDEAKFGRRQSVLQRQLRLGRQRRWQWRRWPRSAQTERAKQAEDEEAPSKEERRFICCSRAQSNEQMHALVSEVQRRRRRRLVATSEQNQRQRHHREGLAAALWPLALLALTGMAAAAAAAASAANALEQQQSQADQSMFSHDESERTSEFWLRSGRRALGQALKFAPNTQRAKNAIIFIGDGMSLSTVTAARILAGQLANRSGEEEQLSFEQLPNVALIKTYNVDQQVPDSAATATAILCGVKANFYTLGVNANVKLNETNCSRVEANQVSSLLRQAQEAGKSTGIVTNTRITHATPAAAYAHTSNRRWECDAYMPRGASMGACRDIARQLIEEEPGARLNVILGGGRRCFFGPNFVDPGQTGQPGLRQDGRNLIEQWIMQRRSSNNENYAFVNCTRDLRSINVDKTDYLLGLFSYSHMAYEELRDQTLAGEPSLSEMTEMAIKILSKNPLGFVLLVEGGRIDHAHHENVAGVALRETISLSWAVQVARNLVDARETLLGVTADHAHALTINGLAPRGNPILGLSRFRENSTQLPYTTLLYGNGPGNKRPRPDPAHGPNSTESPYYVQYAAIHQEEAFHDGSDVAIFAAGPFAHLFQGSQEQSYIAHVFAYALCLADYANQPHCRIDQQGGASLGELDTNSLATSRLDQTGTAAEASNRAATVAPGSTGLGRSGALLASTPKSAIVLLASVVALLFARLTPPSATPAAALFAFN